MALGLKGRPTSSSQIPAHETERAPCETLPNQTDEHSITASSVSFKS